MNEFIYSLKQQGNGHTGSKSTYVCPNKQNSKQYALSFQIACLNIDIDLTIHRFTGNPAALLDRYHPRLSSFHAMVQKILKGLLKHNELPQKMQENLDHIWDSFLTFQLAASPHLTTQWPMRGRTLGNRTQLTTVI